MPKHRIKLHRQKLAVVRSIEILEEIYPARIAQKKAKKEGADAHLAAMDEVLATIDGLDEGNDMRESF